MIRSAIAFFILALFAYIFGAYGIAGVSMDIGKIFIIVFVVLAIISFLGAIISGKKPTNIP